jgi:hypothetical protein
MSKKDFIALADMKGGRLMPARMDAAFEEYLRKIDPDNETMSGDTVTAIVATPKPAPQPAISSAHQPPPMGTPIDGVTVILVILSILAALLAMFIEVQQRCNQ